MSFTGNWLCTSFKGELLSAEHDFGSDTFKLALYTDDATLNAETTEYSSASEVIATGYDAGGVTLTPTSIQTGNRTAWCNFEDVSVAASLTARGGLIYNVTAGNKAVAVLDFGLDRTSTTQFDVKFPTNDWLNAIVRVG